LIRQRWSDPMNRIPGLLLLAIVPGLVPAWATETGFDLASLQTPISAASLLTPRDAADRTLIKENECDPPEAIALIESNREDVERSVVMDR
jgi:hypothetical protein